MQKLFAEIDKIQSRIDACRPLDKKELRQLREYYRVGLTYSSNALEGNSLTEMETKVVIEDGLTIGGKPLKDHYEAIGHSEAFDLMFDLVKKRTITEKDIRKIHHLFYYRIDEENAGTYRKIQVFISGTKYRPPPPTRVPERMKALGRRIPSLCKKCHPVEFASRLHKELVAIHPFVDGNGRTARLIMNLALLQEGYEIVIIPPIRRADYLRAIAKGQISPKDDKPFTSLICEMLMESQKDYLRMLAE